MKWLGWIVLSVALVGIGCSSGTDDPEDAGTDLGTQDVTQNDTGSEDKTSTDEGGTDTQGPSTGLFEDPCTEDAECLSGFCAATGDGFACSQLCDGTCPDGWTCREFVLAGNVSASVCVHQEANLCRPCNSNADCSDWGGVSDDQCVVFGDYEGSFCGTACASNDDCTPGYSCSAVETAGGGSSQQCVPDINECGCNAQAMALKASTDCGTGVCIGSRTCNEDGLTDCSAQISTDEICDGEDNDCNGLVDDDGLGTTLCGVGACQVEQTNCIDGAEQTCTADEPTDESCDGIDNDCDGTTDEELGSSSCGVGECQASVDNCVEGAEQTCVAGEPNTEICDGLDNDCDGSADEELGSSSCGVGECAASVDNCVDGVEQTCAPGTPSAELCDGLDNDCDGSADEELGSTSCGVGECVASVDNCVGGVEQTCVPGTPEAELCDGLDNNCDGLTDETFDLDSDASNCGACGTVCPSGVCSAGSCLAAACDDGVQNGDETDVDCGGSCATGCAAGLGCVSGGDCESGSCDAEVCNAPSCTDGISNGDETGTDCGGGTCSPCVNGEPCLAHSDCESHECLAVTSTCGVSGGTPAHWAGSNLLVITEIMKNPDTRPDAAGEWIELYNRSSDTRLNLNDCELSDDNGSIDNFYLTGLTIAPEQYLTLAIGPIPGFTPDFDYDGQMTLGNGDDEVNIMCGGIEMDSVKYTDAEFPDTAGRSMSLSADSISVSGNNDGSNWCDGVDQYASTADGVSGFDYGTPGAPNPVCP